LADATDFLAESKALRLGRARVATLSGANIEKARALVTGCGCKRGERFEGYEWHHGACVGKALDKSAFEGRKT
jgi:hypothetical protein